MKTLDELFANDESLPTVPRVVSDLIEMLRNDEVSFAAVANRIELDQVLAAKVLQMINSPLFGLRRKISSIQGAILMLGLSAIRSVVVSSGLAGTFRKVEGVSLPAFWAHSLRVASVSRKLASKTRHVDPNLAFTAAACMPSGHLIMAQAMPGPDRRAERPAPLRVARSRATGAGRVRLPLRRRERVAGAALGLRPDLVGGLSSFVSPDKSEHADALGDVLHLAVWRVALERQGVDLGKLEGGWPSQSALAAGITEDVVQEMPAPRELAAELESMIA
ncbi:HDOD domain-containing protein [Ditylenchus destructor]|uniref:HDOD domain-containing protein n=1 Tax=Ditylenchus destructor TaxID=166010 RepID=A0AAD4MG22_9BILA|nr:HDOD domain-containing protein [Ditylenchus destructor]